MKVIISILTLALEIDSVFPSVNYCQEVQSHKNALLLPKPPSCGPIKPTTRIMGGSDAAVGEFPWIVLLKIHIGSSNTMKCDGSIINNRFVLTAAHCLRGFDNKTNTITVILGAHTREDKRAVELTSRHVALHKEFDPGTGVNDIALIRLSADITYNELIYPVCLPVTCDLLNEPLHNKFLTVAGWGLKQKEPMVYTDILQKLVMKTAEKEVCWSKSRFVITDRHICTVGAYVFPQGTCEGDSGGPVMWESGRVTYQVGVVSWGNTCDTTRHDQHNAATRVTSYMLWILDHLSE